MKLKETTYPCYICKEKHTALIPMKKYTVKWVCQNCYLESERVLKIKI